MSITHTVMSAVFVPRSTTGARRSSSGRQTNRSRRQAVAVAVALLSGLALVTSPPAGAAGEQVGCGHPAGAASAWGANGSGQLGTGAPGSPTPTAVSALDLGTVQQMAAGADHTLALKTDGSVVAFGSNFFGQLGIGASTTNKSTPVPVTGLGAGTGVVAVAAGAQHSLALKADGSVLAWGSDVDGQLGLSLAGNQRTPLPVPGLGAGSGVVAVAAGQAHSLALKLDGTVLAWGSNLFGQLGSSAAGGTGAPRQVDGLGAGSGVASIAAGDRHSLAMKKDGTVMAWGANDSGQIGNTTVDDGPTLVAISPPPTTVPEAAVNAPPDYNLTSTSMFAESSRQVVEVRNTAGRPVAGVQVTFTIPAPAPPSRVGATFEGGVSSVTAVTDENGRASAPLLVVPFGVAGTITVVASVGGTATATFTLRSTHGLPGSLAVISDGETSFYYPDDNPPSGPYAMAVTGATTDIHYKVLASDSFDDQRVYDPSTGLYVFTYGNLVPGARILFHLDPTYGSFAADHPQADAVVVTGADGTAKAPPITASANLGSYEVTATVVDDASNPIPDPYGNPSITAYPTMYVTNAAPPTLVAYTGDPPAYDYNTGELYPASTPQTLTVGEPAPARLRAQVQDDSGTGQQWWVVTFTAPDSGPSGEFYSEADGSSLGRVVKVTTDYFGYAIAPPFRANSTAGTYSVQATVPFATGPAIFDLTNTEAAVAGRVAAAKAPSAATSSPRVSAATASSAGGAPVTTAATGTVSDIALSPVPVDGVTGVVEVAAGAANSVGRRANGSIAAWGSVPPPSNPLPPVARIASGGNHVLAALQDGRLFAWGDNIPAPLGSPPPQATNIAVAAPLPDAVSVVAMAAGPTDSFAVQGTDEPCRSPARLVPVVPARVLDTRSGVGSPAGRVGSGGAVEMTVAGHGGVPAAGASAVVLTVTGVDSAPGFVTVWPTGEVRPQASNLNMTRTGQTVAAQVVVPLGTEGKVSLYSSGGGHLLADVAGWYETTAFATSGRFTPVDPSRVLDTRNGTGAPAGAPAADSALTVAVAGHGGVPPTGASAVVVNLTAVTGSKNGFVTAWPDGTRPGVSNLNVDFDGQTVADHVTVPLAADGSFQLYTSAGGHLIVDVEGWFTGATAPKTSSGLFVPVSPERRLDTRAGASGPIGVPAAGPRAAGSTTSLRLAGGLLPLNRVTAVVGNLTAVDAAAGSFLTAWPTGRPQPLASNLNVTKPGDIVPNLVTTAVGSTSASIDLYTAGATHLLFDLAGYYQA